VRIVLSTSWRNLEPLVRLTALLPAPLQERVIGSTPNFGDFQTRPGLVPYHRQAECEQWIAQQGEADRPWIALDDRGQWFTPYCERLVACDPRVGFDADAAARLRAKFVYQGARCTDGQDVLAG
jgi:hypothetical protein